MHLIRHAATTVKRVSFSISQNNDGQPKHIAIHISHNNILTVMQTTGRRTNSQILELANVRITPPPIRILHREHVIAEGSSELQFVFGRHSFGG